MGGEDLLWMEGVTNKNSQMKTILITLAVSCNFDCSGSLLYMCMSGVFQDSKPHLGSQWWQPNTIHLSGCIMGFLQQNLSTFELRMSPLTQPNLTGWFLFRMHMEHGLVRSVQVLRNELVVQVWKFRRSFSQLNLPS